jgi:XTP/dITP diphosphohydrolase
MKIVFATGNPNKLKEIQELIGDRYEVISLKDLDYQEEIPEDFETLEENAHQKADTIFQKFGLPCFADDTGLEIDALDGRPGVYSARYAGPACSPEDNMAKVLAELKGKENRKAKFRTVIAFKTEGETHYFEGEVKGHISHEKMGEKGFGYDPIFVPEGFNASFAQMSSLDKNEISHRGRAVKKFADFLKDN